MPNKLFARILAETTKLLDEAEANERAFAADRVRLSSYDTGRYAVYRQQDCVAVHDTYVDAMQFLLTSGGLPGSVHAITTQVEPEILKRKPPLI